MAESLNPAPRQPYAWTELFRCFQVALDPRKLLVAAIGILLTGLSWNLLSRAFNYDAPDKAAAYYDATKIAKEFEGKRKTKTDDYTPADFELMAKARYIADVSQWMVRDELAGPNGRMRVLPWAESRGENPYQFLSRLAALPPAAWTGESLSYVARQLPVMAEPLTKLLLPVVKLADENATTSTRIYLVLCLFSSLAIWAVCGGIITRIAAVQLSGKDRVSVGDAAAFVLKRYLSYFLSPMVPLGIMGAISVGIMILGLLALIPIVGDVLYIVIIPLVILGGIIMTILLLGMVGYPLMYSTLSVEGSDTFDALSRAYNYVFQAPWTYAWNCIVALAYGAVVTFFIVFVASLMVYLGKWALIRTPLAESTGQQAHYLFDYAPTSFGWKHLLLKGSDIEMADRPTLAADKQVVWDAHPERAKAYRDSYQAWNWIGIAATTVWLTLVFLLMLGFSYSFFWSAAVMVYLLMRQKVDDIDLDDVYLEDDEPLAPATSPAPPAYTTLPMSPPGATSLPTVPAPATVPPPAVPVVPPTSTSSTTLDVPKLEPGK